MLYFQGPLVPWSAVKYKSITSRLLRQNAMLYAFKESAALWLRVFPAFLSPLIHDIFRFFFDDQAARSLSHSPPVSARSRHIDIRHHFIRAHV